MKGLNKRIIEIIEPENEMIDRVIVVLKPGIGRLTVEKKAEISAFVGRLRLKARHKGTLLALIAGGLLFTAFFFVLRAVL